MKTMTIEKAYNEIKTYAANPLGDMRVLDEIPVGYHVRQGDVYVERLESFDKSQYHVTGNRQLAPGATRGSRHTVSDSVTVWEPNVKTEVVWQNNGFTMLGPVVESKERFTIAHPDHADFSVPGGCYQISYQIDPVTMKRVLD